MTDKTMSELPLFVYRIDHDTDLVHELDTTKFVTSLGGTYAEKISHNLFVYDEEFPRFFESKEAARDDYIDHQHKANLIAESARRHIETLTRMGALLGCSIDVDYHAYNDRGDCDDYPDTQSFIKIKQGDYTFRFDISDLVDINYVER